MKRPVLGYVKDQEIVGVRSLTREEFIVFETSYDEINRYMQSGELFAVALLNHDDFSNTLREHLSETGHHNPDYLGNKVYELTSFLTDVLKVENLTASFPHKVGMHISCHGQRGLHLSSMSELV